MLTALVLAAGVLIPSPAEGKATWYAGTGDCYGRSHTCSPYRSKADGGRGGELVRYCAIPKFRAYHDKPFHVILKNVKTGATSWCVVRDYCGCTSGGIIDLSPAVFLELRGRLSAGVVYVRVERTEVWHTKTGGR